MEEGQPDSTTPKERLDESYSKYGITDIPKQSIATTWGQTKTFVGLSVKEVTFLVLTTINILTAASLTIYRLIKVIEDDPEKPDFTFAVLLLINAVFCFFYAYHGVLRERKYELYVLIIAIIVIVLYCFLEYVFLNVSGRTTLKLVRLIIACVLAPPNIYLAWYVAREFGYLQFRTVGASEYLQDLYEQAAIFSCGLKFDVQVTVSIVILVLRKGTDITVFEQVILGIGVPYSLLWNILGWFVLRKEWKPGAILFAVLGLVKPVYYIARIVLEYQDINAASDTITYSILSAGALALLVWMILMLELYVVYRNFGKGLKERAFDIAPTETTSLITGRRVVPT